MPYQDFKLEINSLEAFIMFVTIIRNPDMEVDKISKLTEELRKSTETLRNAVKEQENG